MAENEALWFLCNSRTRFETGGIDLSAAKLTCSEITEEESANWHIWQAGWNAWKPLREVEEFYSLIKRPVVPPPMPAAPPPVPVPPPMPAPPVAKAAEPAVPKKALPPVGVQPQPTTKPVSILQPIPNPSSAATTAAATAPTTPPPVSNSAISMPPPTAQVSEPALPFANRRRFERYALRLRVIIRNEQLTFRTFSRNISLGGICLENPLPPHLFNQKCQIFIAGPNQKANLRLRLAPTSRNDLRYFSFSGLDDKALDQLKRWLEGSVKLPARTA